ncbi:cupin domain-containing protein [Oceanospirillum beijerinckii]|uniref:cupin domain-containing protein n=1 Tax=Oceanospirillum beijerinckii TaxID=64976 RepID=UPI00040DA6E6|nr:cupin domain-containing protein [Oceanospirillum beijerinckii]
MLQLPECLLGQISYEEFLRDYWQKKPLFIKNAIPDFESPIDEHELAGMALEEQVESRLVMEKGPNGENWHLENGPFEESRFSTLPETHWTLLVQAVDHYVPEVAALMEAFDFIPSWRVDDIMISFAPKEGSVGPHLDYYDVFLLQAQGTRRWQLGGFADDKTPIVEGVPLRILREFNVEEEFVCEPGDLLYLPPQLAHYGVSQTDDCMTWSVGFRAPSADEIVTSLADFIGETLCEDDRYGDPDLELQSYNSQIGPDAIARVKTLVLEKLNDDEVINAWFGRYMTQPKYMDQLIPSEEAVSESDLSENMASGAVLNLTEGSRLAFSDTESGFVLFADGEGYPIEAQDKELIMHLCEQKYLTSHELFSPSEKTMVNLSELINRGTLYLSD